MSEQYTSSAEMQERFDRWAAEVEREIEERYAEYRKAEEGDE